MKIPSQVKDGNQTHSAQSKKLDLIQGIQNVKNKQGTNEGKKGDGLMKKLMASFSKKWEMAITNVLPHSQVGLIKCK